MLTPYYLIYGHRGAVRHRGLTVRALISFLGFMYTIGERLKYYIVDIKIFRNI